MTDDTGRAAEPGYGRNVACRRHCDGPGNLAGTAKNHKKSAKTVIFLLTKKISLCILAKV